MASQGTYAYELASCEACEVSEVVDALAWDDRMVSRVMVTLEPVVGTAVHTSRAAEKLELPAKTWASAVTMVPLSP